MYALGVDVCVCGVCINVCKEGRDGVEERGGRERERE